MLSDDERTAGGSRRRDAGTGYLAGMAYRFLPPGRRSTDAQHGQRRSGDSQGRRLPRIPQEQLAFFPRFLVFISVSPMILIMEVKING